MTGERLTLGDYEQLAAFRYALRRFASFSAAAAQEAGLTTHQHQALLAIKASRKAMTIGHLAEQLMIAPHSAAELVGRLEAGGFVGRAGDAGDRRRVVLTLTARADGVLRALTMVHLREVRQLAPRMMEIFKDLDALLG